MAASGSSQSKSEPNDAETPSEHMLWDSASFDVLQELREALRKAAKKSPALCERVRTELGTARRTSGVLYMLLGDPDKEPVIAMVCLRQMLRGDMSRHRVFVKLLSVTRSEM